MEFFCELNKKGVIIIMIIYDMYLMFEYINRVIVFLEGMKLMDDSVVNVFIDEKIIKEVNFKEILLY